MAVQVYKKLEASNIRGTCVKCNERPQKPKAGGKFKSLCSHCDKRRTPATHEATRASRRRHTKKTRLAKRKDCCERCGFIPEHMCQLDLDHIDGDHSNNDPSNHQTLCANCHRLKTFQNQDWALDLRPTHS